jgi:hypothetical protein
MLSNTNELDELTPRMDEHLHYAITECCYPHTKGTMRLQKLALLWMVKDKGKK